MTIDVTGPDGSRISFPDGTDAATINSVMGQHFGRGGDTRPQQSYGGGLLRQAAQGLTFNAADEIEATLPFMRESGEDYNAAATRIRRGNERFSQENPVASFAANVAGGTPLLAFGPGAAAARWAMAARTLPTGARVAGPLRTQVARSAELGAGVGGAYGLGAGEGNVAERIPGALQGAAFGGALGVAVPPVAQGIGAAWGRLQSARAGADPHARVAAGLGDQSVDDLANSAAFGTTNERINRRTLDILGQEMVRANGDRVAAAQAAIQRIQQEAGITEAQARANLRQLLAVHRGSDLMLGEYPAVAGSDRATRNMRPENVTDDMAAATTEPGTQTLMDYVANSGTMASSQNVRNAVGQRAATQGERTREVVEGLSPGGRTIQDVDEMLDNVRRSGRMDYDAVYRAPGGLGPDGQPVVNQGVLYSGLGLVVRRALNRMRNMGGDQLASMREALDRFYIAPQQGIAGRAAAQSQPNPLAARMAAELLPDRIAEVRLALNEARRQGAPRDAIDQLSRQADDLIEQLRLSRRDAAVPNERTLTTSLEAAQNARSAIRGQIQSARRAGRDDIATILQPLYDDVTNVMERSSPLWARANRNWAELRLEEVAEELGDAFAKRAGPRYRQQLEQFQNLAPEAQDIVRVHFVQQMLDQIDNAVKLGSQQNLGRLFALSHTRNAIRTILGDEAAVTVARLVRDANVMARSQQGLRGSQTHVRGQVQREQDADINAISSATNLDWRNWHQAAFDYLVGLIRERRNRTLGRTLTTPMRDMPAVAENVERMRQAAQRVEQANQPRLPPALNRGLLPFMGAVAPVGPGRPGGR